MQLGAGQSASLSRRSSTTEAARARAERTPAHDAGGAMKHTMPPDVATVDRALRHCGEHVVQTSPSRWSLELRNGKAMHMRAVLADAWLTLAARVPLDATPELPWRLLMLNGMLSRAARFTLEPRSYTACIRIDVQFRKD